MKVEMTKLFSTIHKEVLPSKKAVVVTRSQTIPTPLAITSRLSVHKTSKPLSKQVQLRLEKVHFEPTSSQVVAPQVKRRWKKVPSLIHKAPKEQTSPISNRAKRLLFANTTMCLEGILKEGNEGLYYLAIDQSLFMQMRRHFLDFPMEEVPFNPEMGPSLPVIMPSERPFGLIPIDSRFSFEIADVFVQEHCDWPGVTSSLSVTLSIPSIVSLRAKCGLCNTPLMKPFTITLGVVHAERPHKEKGYYVVNVSESPA